MPNALYDPVLELESYNTALLPLKEGKAPKTLLLTGVVDSEKIHLAAALCRHTERPALIIAPSEIRAREIYEDMHFFFSGRARFYPSRDILFYSADVRSAAISKQRLAILNAFVSGENPAVVLSAEALFDPVTPPEIFKKYIFDFSPGDKLDGKEFSEKLLYMGYERRDLAEAPGQFSIRGGIIDVYGPLYDYAVRMELWDDEIDSIRFVDTLSQRSVEKADRVRIFPMRDLVFGEHELEAAVERIQEEFEYIKEDYERKGLAEERENLTEAVEQSLEKMREGGNLSGLEKYLGYFYQKPASLLDYVDKNTLLFFDEPQRIAVHCEAVREEFIQNMQNRMEKGYILPGQVNAGFSYAQILAGSENFTRILLTTITQSVKDFRLNALVSFQVKSSGIVRNRVDLLEGDIQYLVEQNYRVLILAGGKTRAERLCAELLEKGIPARKIESLEDASIERGKVGVHGGSVNRGFEYPLIGFSVMSCKEIFDGDKRRKKPKRKKQGSPIESFADLRNGDYVVHDTHGIGVYQGIEKINVDNVSRDYLKIAYKDGGALYVSTSEMDALQKFIGGEGVKPKVNKLGGGEWQKAKARVKKAVEEIAKDLVELYAKRENAAGFSYSGDTGWQAEFEETFPYDETDDQLLAIEDVKKDMESPKVMDRLICGDVGYGKTEIAIRAAFKAVADGKQVAYLVPTTILAQQHYNTFTQRMKDYPVNISLLSRFRTKKEQDETISKLKSGSVDIVIGTHRLLSKDVGFRDLGLVIVDEEQRFGVTHKEKLKKLCENVDVLTLTATPIPRTLHMSLSGIRDMSLLEEPPEERQPIQTYVMEYNPELVREAINRELVRDGQVYYLHNRVRNIGEMAAKVQQLCPNASVAFAHGQLTEHELENIMMDFIAGDIDVLVCTTIIETGLDIPNVNTIIIQDADHMGLSQLYQLRGRVGRSSRSSFAYLMYKKDKVLTEQSEKRLQTIREFTEFGSGFKIAMRDLEIRGAGNILGEAQSGHMDAVGYDMYCKLLRVAVSELKGEEVEPAFETLMDINVNAYIPNYYIRNEEQKLEVYKKIALIQNQQDFMDVFDEITDRYGDLPPPVHNLLNVARLKAFVHKLGAISVVQKGRNIVINFKSDAKVDPLRIGELIKANKERLLFTIAQNPYITYKLAKDEEGECLDNIYELMKTLV